MSVYLTLRLVALRIPAGVDLRTDKEGLEFDEPATVMDLGV